MSDKIAKTTARLMLQKINKQLDDLFAEQESKKPIKTSKYKCGGTIKKKMQFGGFTDLINQAFDYATSQLSTMPSTLGTTGYDFTQLAPSYTNNDLPLVSATQPAKLSTMPSTLGTTGYDFTQLAPSYTNNDLPLVSATQPANWLEGGLRNINFGNIALNAAALAPVAYNVAMGLHKPRQINSRDFYNPYAGKVENLMANRRYNIQPVLERNMASENALRRNLTNIAASPGQLSSNLLGASAARMRADAAAYAQKSNIENQYRGEEANTLNALGRQMSSTDIWAENANQQALARQRAYMGAGAGQLSQWAQMQQLMGNQRLRDQQMASMLPDVFSNIMRFSPELMNIVRSFKS